MPRGTDRTEEILEWDIRWDNAPSGLQQAWRNTIQCYKYVRAHPHEYAAPGSLDAAMNSSTRAVATARADLNTWCSRHGSSVRRGAGPDPPEADPEARFFDEEPEQPENDPNGDACKMMELLEDHAEALGSEAYVNLANITGNFAKLERRAARMRKKLLEYDGSDCSALMPSDDEHIDEDDFIDEDDEFDHSSNASLDSEDRVMRSRASTTSSAAGDEIDDPGKTTKGAALNPSGYFIKYMDTYYSVPKQAIMRHYQRPIEVPNTDTFRKRTIRGARAREWRWEPINPASVIVIKMKNRTADTGNAGNTGDGGDYYWCVSLKLEGGPANDDGKILHVLPETTVDRLVRTLEADETMRSSSLLTKYKPSWISSQVVMSYSFTRTLPIPGPSRKRSTAPGEEASYTGNYWPRLRASKRIRSALDRPIRINDSDED